MLATGSGVYTDTGCTTASGTDSNTYYGGITGTSGGRLNACKVLLAAAIADSANYGWNSCNTSPNVNGAFPFVADYTKNPPSHARQVSEAATLGCTGSGTISNPITSCP